MIEAIQQYASEIISAMAVILAAAANWRAVRAEKVSKKAQKTIRRMDILLEIERKNAVVGQLALITSQKILLLQEYPQILNNSADELDRLKSNLELISELKSQEKLQQQFAETANAGNEIELYMQALTDTKRLCIRIEADLEKETRVYRELLEKISKVQQITQADGADAQHA